jgi:hypothetical protein
MLIFQGVFRLHLYKRKSYTLSYLLADALPAVYHIPEDKKKQGDVEDKEAEA